MLFQPSNILPDVINGTGNGTIDIFEGLSVSWQVNGNSQMTAYKIDVYKNDTDSTPVYSTDKVSLGTPFSGVDYQGNIQRFNATKITATAISTYATAHSTDGIEYGEEYKLKITQYYTDANILTPGTTPVEKSVEQRSMSVFYVRYAPDVTIASISNNKVTTREYSFTATYIQQNGDAMSWARWELYKDTGEVDYSQTMANQKAYRSNLLYDTGKLYGVSVLQFDYDAFLNNTDYFLALTVETSYGVQYRTTKKFSTQWEESVLTEEVIPKANRVNRQSTAVKVIWNGFKYITGVPEGNVQVRNDMAIIEDGNSSVNWSEVNGSELSLVEPWVLMMKTQLNRANATIIKLYDSSDNMIVEIVYQLSGRSIRVACNGMTGYLFETPIGYEDTIKLMVTPSKFKYQFSGYGGLLLPDAITLVPRDGLVPREQRVPYTESNSINLARFVQLDIARIEVTGIQNIDYIQVVSGDDYVTETTIEEMDSRLFGSTEYNPNVNTFEGTEFLATFSNGTLDAGRLTIADTTITGWAVYRESERLNEILHLVDADISASSLYDYGCGSYQGRYRYLIYPIGNQKYITAGLFTEWLEPCYENWSIVEAESVGNEYYKVINEYVFGKNFSSGSVSNNNSPSISKNFTRYATVQMDNANYQSGTLSGLIGYIGYVSYTVQEGDTIAEIATRFGTTAEQIIEDNPDVSSMDALTIGQIIKVFYPDGIVSYHDDKELRDSIWALSTTQHYLFLKNRKGDVIEIRIAGEISFETMDASPLQPLSVSLPWVQVGDARRARIIGGVS